MNIIFFNIIILLNNIENDIQMCYIFSNDIHFIINYNSIYNLNNQSELNLIIEFNDLIYNIIFFIFFDIKLSIFNNINDNQIYIQSQLVYIIDNVNELFDNLKSYNYSRKINHFRIYIFFL